VLSAKRLCAESFGSGSRHRTELSVEAAFPVRGGVWLSFYRRDPSGDVVVTTQDAAVARRSRPACGRGAWTRAAAPWLKCFAGALFERTFLEKI
jgi:hypothetical protein